MTASHRTTRISPTPRLVELESRSVPAVSLHGPYTTGELQSLAATNADVWRVRAELAAPPAEARTYFDLAVFIPARLDVSSFQIRMTRAGSDALALALPKPDGTFARFRVREYSMMEPALAAQFPTFKTYRGEGVDDPTASLALDVTALGVHAQVLSPEGSWYVDPYWHLQTNEYVSYYGKDLRNTHGGGCPCALCLAAVSATAGEPSLFPATDQTVPPAGSPGVPVLMGPGGPPGFTNGDMLRTYRLAVAATGEYTAFFGGTVAKGQSAIVTAVNRVNQIYLNDLSMQFTLVGNNSSLVYTDAKNDPYTSGNTQVMNGENQSNLDDTAVLGNANYDVGHVFDGTGFSGWATGFAGQTGTKARGASASATPNNDAFFVQILAHELGHQFSASHTFNSNDPDVASQYFALSAYEPGAGSTIMSYGGNTNMGADDFNTAVDPYFHWASLSQIVNYIAVTIANVGTATPILNPPPHLGAITSAVIPANTPFWLGVVASDTAGQVLTYTMEESDLGPAQAISDPDNGSSPLFRSLLPSTNATRYFPRIDLLAANKASVAEQLPVMDRTMHFTATVRDNRAGGGAFRTSDDIAVKVVSAAGPFRVTDPGLPGTVWAGKSAQTVTWKVAGTNGNGIDAADVEITMSTDGGLTYPISILSSTPNDGSEVIIVPNVATSTARFKVGGIPATRPFFDINDVDITITYTPKVTTWTGAEPLTNPNTWEDPDNWSNGVPGPGDTAIFQGGSKSIGPTLSVPASIGRLQIDASWNGLHNINAPLTITGASAFDAGLIIVAPSAGITSTGTVTLNNPLEVRIAGGGTWTNEGTMVQVGPGGLAIDGKTTTLFTTPTGVFDLQSDSEISSNGGPGLFSNTGTFRRSPGVGTGTGSISCSFYLSGTVDVQSTKLELAPGGSTNAEVSSAHLKVQPGATLYLAKGGSDTVDYSGPITASGGGTLELVSGFLKLAADTTFDFPAPMFQFNGATIDLNGKTLTNVAGSTLSFGAGHSYPRLTGDGTLTNKGTIIQAGIWPVLLSSAKTVLANVHGGLYDMQSDSRISHESVPGTFTSAGTLRRSVSAGKAVIESHFAITGTVEVQTGTLAFAPQATTGAVSDVIATVNKSAVLDLTGGRTVIYAGAITANAGATGPGTVTLPGGQMSITTATTFAIPDTMFQWTDATTVNGTINVAAGVTLTNLAGSFMTLSSTNPVILTGEGTLSNAGTIRQTGTRELLINGSSTILSNETTGVYEVQSTGAPSFSGTSGTFANKGLFRKSVNAGTATMLTNFTNADGTIDVQTGTLDLPGTVDLGKGTLQGAGTVLAPVTNADGTVRPGNSPGKLTVSGNYGQSGGSLAVELNGTAAGTSYDQLAVNGTVSLAGTLSVAVGYAAQVNDSYVIINNDGTGDAVAGTFNGLVEGAKFNAGGATLQISYKGGDGNDVQLKVVGLSPPKVAGVVINGGASQRSRVTNLTVTFDQIVTLPPSPAAAFGLKRQSDNAAVTLAAAGNNTGPGTAVTLTFTGGPVESGSLADGRYTLKAFAAQISNLDGNGDGTGGDDYVLVGDPAVNTLYRRFGDADGDGDVDAQDYGAFRGAFGSTTSLAYDFDNDGDVDAADFGQFRGRFGAAV